MKVILSVQPIQFPMTGIGRYTLELGRELSNVPDMMELKFFADDHFVDALPVPQESRSTHASFTTKIKQRLARNRVLLELYRRHGQSRRAAVLAGMEDYLYHGPNFYLPPFEGRSVVTIHDLSVFTMPEHHPVERVMLMHKEVEFSLTQASMLITDSEYTRREVAAYFGWPLEKIEAVPLAGASEFYPRTADSIRPVLQRYALQPGGYALYTGTIEPRKNLIRLLDAYGRMPQPLRMRYPLILAGYKGWNNAATMNKIAQATREGWARYLGFVPAEDLPILFAGARLFAFPSLYEGFGLPVLEAMASGVPVVTSTSSSLLEVTGGAAASCAPEDEETLKDLLQQGLDDESWRSAAVRNGLTQAAKFSWKRCAQETAQVYRKTLAL